MTVTYRKATQPRDFSKDLSNQISKLIELHQGWETLLISIRQTLFLLSLIYIRSERIVGDPQETRSSIAFHLWVLNSLLDDLVPYYNANESERTEIIENTSLVSIKKC